MSNLQEGEKAQGGGGVLIHSKTPPQLSISVNVMESLFAPVTKKPVIKNKVTTAPPSLKIDRVTLVSGFSNLFFFPSLFPSSSYQKMKTFV